jgi:hypothetical protein
MGPWSRRVLRLPRRANADATRQGADIQTLLPLGGARPVRVPRPWVAMLLECPRDLHCAMKIIAAEDQVKLQELCFMAFEKLLRRRGVHPAEDDADRPDGPV